MMSQLNHKTALVTGGSDGIGKEVALGLARTGMHVVIVGRDAVKGNVSATELRDTVKNPLIDFVVADLSRMRGVRRLVRFVVKTCPQLHYLVHSAGIVRGRRELTTDGVEWNFAVNYLSRFHLTLDLLPLLQVGARPDDPGRILVVGGAAQFGRVYFEDVNLTNNFTTARSVLQFQCANDIFTAELARRLQAASSPVNINVLKYGIVKTNIRAEMPTWMRALSLILDPLIGQTPKEASKPALKLLLDPEFKDVSGGMFVYIRRLRGGATPAVYREPEPWDAALAVERASRQGKRLGVNRSLRDS